MSRSRPEQPQTIVRDLAIPIGLMLLGGVTFTMNVERLKGGRDSKWMPYLAAIVGIVDTTNERRTVMVEEIVSLWDGETGEVFENFAERLLREASIQFPGEPRPPPPDPRRRGPFYDGD